MKRASVLLLTLVILAMVGCGSKLSRETKKIEREVKKASSVEELEQLALRFNSLISESVDFTNPESITDREREANQSLIATYDSVYPIVWNKVLKSKIESLEIPSEITSLQEALKTHTMLLELPETIGREGMSSLLNVVMGFGESKTKQELIDVSNSERLKEINQEILKQAQKYKDEVPIEITSMYTSRPNFVGGVDVRITFRNTSGDQTFKYVFLEVTPYNAVGDVVTDEMGRSTRRLKATGPYKPGQRNTDAYYWGALWYDPSIKRMELDRVELVFMDGTEQVYEDEWVNLIVEE